MVASSEARDLIVFYASSQCESEIGKGNWEVERGFHVGSPPPYFIFVSLHSFNL